MRPPSEPRSTIDRRDFLRIGGVGLAGSNWLTPISEVLAARAERTREPAQSLILLWLAGGASQLETFDPHPQTAIAGGTRAIATAVPGLQLAEGFEQLAGLMGRVALVRSLVSREGDHERGSFQLRTGYRPAATFEYPSLGAICCHELPGSGVDIPRHVTILPNQWPSRGGFLGGGFDAFRLDDPIHPVRDAGSIVPEERDRNRLADLEVVERAFARGRAAPVAAIGHASSTGRARALMSSAQLRAFNVLDEPIAVRRAYGETPFGRACLAARRLTEAGVRCVEVTLDGWDSHVNNHEIHRKLVAQLDPALSALIGDLDHRGRLDRTIIACAGEFGRTPRINPLGGRDHWPNGFSLALAGGGLRGGVALGATDPEGKQPPANPWTVADIHATILATLGIDPRRELVSPIGRPIRLSEGRVITELVG